ncbi:redoxin domain-containing protein [Sphingomonas sp. AOB5]|uniref:peroxiredoxin n=1 Tax=Sphingomonas sp. AOB5 TaxID=3034017 RepID=UPI0023F713C5|nr:redoxin domain-containing protein [Sphingomonas sp. AOB5]MDF7776053.1 redoxin domain-containing protein [Sphingomonas sp. AOB5]
MRPYAFAAIALTLSIPASAALAPGATAPVFTANGAMAGKPFQVKLADALKKGPVVLYFFPAAFTGGCNIEAQAFAKAIPDFKAAGATVIGMTGGNVDQLSKFSAEHCAGQFPVAVADAKIVKDYDVALPNASGRTAGWTTRTSYVIAPNGKVVFAHNDMNPNDHIRLTLEEVRKLRAKRMRR